MVMESWLSEIRVTDPEDSSPFTPDFGEIERSKKETEQQQRESLTVEEFNTGVPGYTNT